ncbi:MAG: hypothetical protein H6816_01580 [Phycisphaerales bacterium]|nr:hypothetical protein [Phycisphaerales bacterium]
MPVEKEPKLGIYIDAFKAWLPTVRLRVVEWAEACREEPALIWQTNAVRYTTYACGGLLAIWLLVGIVDRFGPEKVAAPARTADFHVVCTNPDCGHHFVINRKFGFHKFPVTCPECKKETGERAVRCVNGPRNGQWVPATVDEHGQLVGALCSEPPGS